MSAASRGETAGDDLVSVPKMGEIVAGKLRRRIVHGELREGASLPPEAVLVEQFGVSRPTVREALRILETEALITIRRGSRGGAIVHVPTGQVAARFVGHVLEHQGIRLSDVCEARSVLEPPCVAMVARRRKAADLATLRAAIEEAEAVDDPTGRTRLQIDFHELVLSLSGNGTLTVMARMIRHIIDWALESRFAAPPVGLSPSQAVHEGARSHRRLLELIEAKDADGAERLWRRHLEQTSAYLLEAPGADEPLDLLDGVGPFSPRSPGRPASPARV